MDTSTMKLNQLNTTVGIKIGNPDAPVKIIEFINLRCPYCRQWFNDEEDTLAEYVASGQIQRVIKLFDKTKPSLAKGNIMHKYVPKDGSPASLAAIKQIYDTQEQWGNLESFEEIRTFAEDNLQLTLDEDLTSTEAIVAEAANANIIFVPTMIVGDQVFDQKISQEDLKQLLNSL